MLGLLTDGRGRMQYGRWRQLQCRHLSDRLMAWDYTARPFARAGDLIWYDDSAAVRDWTNFRFDPSKVDTGLHRSFVRGEMPPAVYADFLEENAVPMPAAWYDRLRGWEG